MAHLHVYKNRTNVIQVWLGYNVSTDTITSEIREGKDVDSHLIASWVVSHLTNGVDGKLVLTLDNSVLAALEAEPIDPDETAYVIPPTAWMDLKRVSAGEPLGVLTKPIRVQFEDVVTA